MAVGELIKTAIDSIQIELEQTHQKLKNQDPKASIRLERAVRALTSILKEHREHIKLQAHQQSQLPLDQLIDRIIENPSAKALLAERLQIAAPKRYLPLPKQGKQAGSEWGSSQVCPSCGYIKVAIEPTNPPSASQPTDFKEESANSGGSSRKTPAAGGRKWGGIHPPSQTPFSNFPESQLTQESRAPGRPTVTGSSARYLDSVESGELSEDELWLEGETEEQRERALVEEKRLRQVAEVQRDPEIIEAKVAHRKWKQEQSVQLAQFVESEPPTGADRKQPRGVPFKIKRKGKK